MSLSAQAKVLRVIQEQKIERVGGEQTIDTDVRIVAATNKDLEAECRGGRFRQDLFFRLNVIPIKLPPLRDRGEDAPMLLLHFLKDLDAPEIELDEEAARFLSSYPWPGNIRELKNLAERILVMSDGDRIGVEALMNLIQKKPDFSEKNAQKTPEGDGQTKNVEDIFMMNYNDAKGQFEKQYLEFQLARHEGIISKTAEAIGIYPSNLHAKLRKYNIRTDR
jgi:two-component system nitrogen regulation response regulator NtrX